MTISAAEMRIRRALLEHADVADLDVTYRQVLAMAKIATRAAKEPRPKDGEPRGTTGGRKAAVRPSAARQGGSAGSETRATLAGLQGPSEAFGGAR